jgi:hypothetical protein
MNVRSSALSRTSRAGFVALALASAAISAPATAHSDELSYVFYADGGDTSMGSGNTEVWRQAQALRAGRTPFLFMSENGTSYVIRDAATLARVSAIMAPQRDLGRRQGALGREQGELGRRQGALGAQQARIALDGGAQRQAELGRQQAALGRQQAELGSRQADLGRQQARAAAAAQSQMRTLLADAIRRGVAQRVR